MCLNRITWVYSRGAPPPKAGANLGGPVGGASPPALEPRAPLAAHPRSVHQSEDAGSEGRANRRARQNAGSEF
eukprot:4504576-Pyramimonas_sp.AAC.1